MRLASICLAVCMAISCASSAHAQSVSNPDVRAYLQGSTVRDGPPEGRSGYDVLVAVSELADASELIALLEAESEDAWWQKAVAVLGASGAEPAADALIAFVERLGVRGQPLSIYHEEARREAISALGVLVNRSGSDRALNYLIDSLTPTVWRSRNVKGFSVGADSYEETYQRLSVYAIFGLAFSGHGRAGEALRSLQQSPTPAQEEFLEREANTLAQWLEVYDLVADRGIAETYEYYAAQARVEAKRSIDERQRLRRERDPTAE